jgi:hypothetical protein
MLHPEAPDERAASALGHAGFRYGSSSELFSGRDGEGPLVLALDTNVVIHLTQRFDDVVGGLGFVGLQPGLWNEPDLALQDLFAVWFWRHVAVHISDLVLDDARRQLSAERQALRLRALRTFADDRWLRDPDAEEAARPINGLPEPAGLPPGRDGELVRDAVQQGAHAFVTFDRGVLQYDVTLAPWALRLCDPAWLLDRLRAAGELSVLPVGALPPVADLLMLSGLYGLLEE